MIGSVFQVSIIQYGVDPKVMFYLNRYSSRESMLAATAHIPQLYGLQTNTFRAIDFARYLSLLHPFLPAFVHYFLPTFRCIIISVVAIGNQTVVLGLRTASLI